MRGSIKPLPPDFWRQLLHTLDMFKPLQTGIATLALLGVCTGSAAQWARKPSYYEDQQQPTGILANPVPPASSLPGAPSAGLPNSSPAQAMADMNGPAELPSLANRADFDRMARVYNAGTPLAQPHVIFVIDRQPRASTAGKPAPQLHFVNTPRFQLHDRFVRETGLFAGSPQQFNRNYEAPDRRLDPGHAELAAANSSLCVRVLGRRPPDARAAGDHRQPAEGAFLCARALQGQRAGA